MGYIPPKDQKFINNVMRLILDLSTDKYIADDINDINKYFNKHGINPNGLKKLINKAIYTILDSKRSLGFIVSYGLCTTNKCVDINSYLLNGGMFKQCLYKILNDYIIDYKKTNKLIAPCSILNGYGAGYEVYYYRISNSKIEIDREYYTNPDFIRSNHALYIENLYNYIYDAQDYLLENSYNKIITHNKNLISTLRNLKVDTEYDYIIEYSVDFLIEFNKVMELLMHLNELVYNFSNALNTEAVSNVNEAMINLNSECVNASKEFIMLYNNIEAILNNESLNEFEAGVLYGKYISMVEKIGIDLTHLNTEDAYSNTSRRNLEIAQEGIKELLNNIGNNFVQTWQDNITPVKSIISGAVAFIIDKSKYMSKLSKSLNDVDEYNIDLTKQANRYKGLLYLLDNDLSNMETLLNEASKVLVSFTETGKLEDVFIKYNINTDMKRAIDEYMKKQIKGSSYDVYRNSKILGFKPGKDKIAINLSCGVDKDQNWESILVSFHNYNMTYNIPSNFKPKIDIRELREALNAISDNMNKYRNVYSKVSDAKLVSKWTEFSRNASNIPSVLLDDRIPDKAKYSILYSLPDMVSAMCNSHVTLMNECIEFLISTSKYITKQ